MNEDRIERHVRAHFEGLYRAPAPGFEARMRAGLAIAPSAPGRARWALVAVILAAATVLALTLPRLLSFAPTPGNRVSGVVPWLSLPAQLDAPPPPPSPSPSPLPSGTQPCTSAQVQINVLGSGGAGGHVMQSFGFAGRGPGSCFLQGTPAIEVFDRSGKLLPFEARAPFLPYLAADPILVKPGPLPDIRSGNGLRPGQASVTIEWVSQPEACPLGSPGVRIAMARITLPGGGAALSVHIPGVPNAYLCAGLGIGTFQGPVPPVVEAPKAPVASVTLHLPSTARAGGDLVYQVVLTNDTATRIDLIANCPDFGQDIFAGHLTGPPHGLKPLFQLNCAPAGTIEPGASLTFEIRLAIRSGTPPGTYSLFFTLGFPWDGMNTPVSATVTITD